MSSNKVEKFLISKKFKSSDGFSYLFLSTNKISSLENCDRKRNKNKDKIDMKAHLVPSRSIINFHKNYGVVSGV